MEPVQLSLAKFLTFYGPPLSHPCGQVEIYCLFMMMMMMMITIVMMMMTTMMMTVVQPSTMWIPHGQVETYCLFTGEPQF